MKIAMVTITTFEIIPKFFSLAFGCPDVPVSENTWFKRTPDGASIGCKDTDDTWKLTCKNNQWIGPRSNCTSSEFLNKQLLTSSALAFTCRQVLHICAELGKI